MTDVKCLPNSDTDETFIGEFATEQECFEEC